MDRLVAVSVMAVLVIAASILAALILAGVTLKRSSAIGAVTALLCLTLGGLARAAAPPIDCRTARGAVDEEICGSSEFRAMDRELTALYDRGMASFAPDDRHRLADSQLGFLKHRRGCEWAAHHSAHPGVAVEECVRSAMEGRLHALRAAVDHGGY